MLRYVLVLCVGASLLTGLWAAENPADQRPTREEWQKMSPEERQARIKELREKYQKMTPEQRQAQRKIWRERMEKRIEELKKKKAAGTITEPETKRLELWERRLKLWDQHDHPDKPAGQPGEGAPEKKQPDKAN